MDFYLEEFSQWIVVFYVDKSFFHAIRWRYQTVWYGLEINHKLAKVLMITLLIEEFRGTENRFLLFLLKYKKSRVESIKIST